MNPNDLGLFLAELALERGVGGVARAPERGSADKMPLTKRAR